MPSIEQRGQRFRLIFRFNQKKHFVNLKSVDRRDAEICLLFCQNICFGSSDFKSRLTSSSVYQSTSRCL
jgi:hypothetical protein